MSPKSMSSRRRLRLAAVAGVAAVSLSACGVDLHPGAAAVVNGSTITQGTVDDTVVAACHFIEIGNKANDQSQTIAVTDLRASFTGAFVSVKIFRKLLDEKGLTIEDSDLAQAASQNQVPDGMSKEDSDALEQFFSDVAEIGLSQSLVQAHDADPSVTSTSQLSQDNPGDQETDTIPDFFKAQDVDVSPQYGTWNGSTVTFSSGSLSKAVSDAAKGPKVNADGGTDTADLPPTQVCG